MSQEAKTQQTSPLTSRGLKLDVLKSSGLWWNGPSFLVEAREGWLALIPIKRAIRQKRDEATEDNLRHRDHINSG